MFGDLTSFKETQILLTAGDFLSCIFCLFGRRRRRRRRRTCSPINCQWGNWIAYGTCSVSCGGGSQPRVRHVAVQPSCGGAGCSGPSGDSHSCNIYPCPVNCVWSLWSAYGKCSVTCGGGSQTRTRSVARQHSCGGTSCSGPSTQSQTCNSQCCPVDCVWGPWSVFGACSVTCGGGRQEKRRSIAIQQSCGGSSCSGPSTQSQTCNSQCCPVDCVWGSWSNFGACSVTCGVGRQEKSRSVVIQQSCGGIKCAGSSTQSQSCNSQCCPVDCVWDSWSAYGACSVTCGGGHQIRNRSVAVQPSCGGLNCSGLFNQSQSCNSQCCPVNCTWGSWNAYSACSVTCGEGFKNRKRQIAVASACGGLECEETSTENTTCNLTPCPVHCQWSEWSDWEECSRPCGGGTQTRWRKNSVVALHGGIECNGSRNNSR